MKPFKVGDRIRCIDSDSAFLVLGRVYTMSGEGEHDYISLKEIDGSLWLPYRFERVHQPITLPDELFTL